MTAMENRDTAAFRRSCSPSPCCSRRNLVQRSSHCSVAICKVMFESVQDAVSIHRSLADKRYKVISRPSSPVKYARNLPLITRSTPPHSSEGCLIVTPARYSLCTILFRSNSLSVDASSSQKGKMSTSAVSRMFLLCSSTELHSFCHHDPLSHHKKG